MVVVNDVLIGRSEKLYLPGEFYPGAIPALQRLIGTDRVGFLFSYQNM